jgi:hydroxypyruvate isomerase
MPRLKFAANLSWLYTDLPFLDRFEAAARDGFKGVECLFPHEHPQAEIAARLKDWGLQLVLFNAAPGQWDQGERGLACLAGREADFQRSIEQALALAQALDCPRIHVMAGLVADTDGPHFVAAMQRYTNNLQWAAERAQAQGKALMIEPINRRDMPGYLLTHQAQAHGVAQALASSALQVQMDLYHCQITEGDVTHRLRQWVPTGRVGHLQIAGVPDRGEPDEGELNYAYVLEQLIQLGYGGWIGCEYRPRRAGPGATSAGLGWLRALDHGALAS